DVSLRNGDVAAGDPGKNSRGEEQRERIGESHERETDGRADNANEQNRAATETIGKLPEDRGENDLHPRINPGEPADRDGGRMEVLRVKGQNGDDDPEAHQVDED